MYVDFLIVVAVCMPILMFGAKLLMDFGLVKGDLYLVFDLLRKNNESRMILK
jgi:hypothetical protein